MAKGKAYLGLGLLVGGAGAVAAAWWLGRKKAKDLSDAVNQPPVKLPLSAVDEQKLESFQVHATGYWPYQAGLSESERKMEGSTVDRKRRPIITLEMHQQDPAKYPYVSVAGDYTIFPDGQRLILSPWPDLVFRVVDTGGHFAGPRKVYRVWGEEPLDIAVNSSKTPVPKKDVTAKIVPGDHFEIQKGIQDVATGKLKGQTVTMLGTDCGTKDYSRALAILRKISG